jgi:hypothetical protein
MHGGKRTLIVGAILLGVAGTCAATGVSLVPVSLALGPCLRDWTSPSSYRTRASPLATLDAAIGDGALRLCYGRPSMRSRTVFGQLVPWDTPWRLGANEPTRLYLNRPVRLAGIALEPGRYAIYVVPRPGAWQVYVSRSVLHWGNDISAGVRAREVGQATVPVMPLSQPVETLTVQPLPDGDGAVGLAIDWERTRVVLEVRPR